MSGSKLSQILRISTVARDDLVFVEKDGASAAALAAAFDPMDETVPLISALTGGEISPLMQDGARRRTTLMDQIRFAAAVRAGLVFDSRVQAIALVAALSLPLNTVIATGGYASAGDGGGATYCRVASEPSHDGKFYAGGWWELKVSIAKPEMFGAKGDATTNDKVPLQSAFDLVPAGVSVELRSGATYLASDLVLPGGSNTSRIFAQGRATIKAVASANTQYLAATKSFVENLTYVSGTLSVENIIFDGSSVVDYAVAATTYYARFVNCQFSGGNILGSYLTEKTSDGTTNAPSVVDNVFTTCMWLNNAGGGFGNSINAQDFQIIGGHCFNNGGLGFDFGTSAGLNMIGVQIYANAGGAARFANFGFQSNVIGNNFDGEVTISSLSPAVDSAVLGSNSFKDGDLICTLGGANTTETLIVDAPHFMGTARLRHNYNAATRKVIVYGGSSEAEGPFIWAFGSPSGIIEAVQHYNVPAGGYLNGRMDIRPTSFVGGRAANEVTIRKALAASTTTTLTVEVDLSIDQLAGSDIEVDLKISTLENSFTNVRVAGFEIFAMVARKASSSGTANFVDVLSRGESVASGISVAGAWMIVGGAGPLTATLTITITHNTPNIGSVLAKVSADHSFATAMRVA